MMNTFELKAAFARHGIDRQDWSEFARLIRTGKASELPLYRPNYQACGRELIGVKDWRLASIANRPRKVYLDRNRLYLDDILARFDIPAEYWPEVYTACCEGRIDDHDRWAVIHRLVRKALPAICERINRTFDRPACSAAAA